MFVRLSLSLARCPHSCVGSPLSDHGRRRARRRRAPAPAARRTPHTRLSLLSTLTRTRITGLSRLCAPTSPSALTRRIHSRVLSLTPGPRTTQPAPAALVSGVWGRTQWPLRAQLLANQAWHSHPFDKDGRLPIKRDMVPPIEPLLALVRSSPAFVSRLPSFETERRKAAGEKPPRKAPR